MFRRKPSDYTRLQIDVRLSVDTEMKGPGAIEIFNEVALEILCQLFFRWDFGRPVHYGTRSPSKLLVGEFEWTVRKKTGGRSSWVGSLAADCISMRN